jgi:ABC-type glycerol-3-phosphate transport system substrate-binding protein
MSKFQIVLSALFVVFIVGGVLSFALYRGGRANVAKVTIWGDISEYDFSELMSNKDLSQDNTVTITYKEKSPETIDTEFTESLAEGTGPDLIILTQDKLWKNKSKLMLIPNSSVSDSDFKKTFVEEGELFQTETGTYALPVTIDPLVLYYNRDLLSNAGQAKPISYWDEIYAASTNLSKKDAAGNIVASTIALGEARNIPNYKDIFSLLMLQAGTPITAFVGSSLRSQISNTFDLPVAPGESALDFYTQFSNPTKTFYSWNRSLINAQNHFASGDSAYYIGFASEYRTLKNKNPTLNFAVAPVPQSRVGAKTLTFARIRGIAISRGSANQAAALIVASKLISKDIQNLLSGITYLPPVRRDLLSAKPSDSTLSVFYTAALQSKGWLDPDVEATAAVFREAIESVTSGRARTAEAINKASREVDTLIK